MIRVGLSSTETRYTRATAIERIGVGSWTRGYVAVFNVLEYTFDPNFSRASRRNVIDSWSHHPCGHCTATPVTFGRLNPNWYREFARRNKLILQSFCWISQLASLPVTDELPSFLTVTVGRTSSPSATGVRGFATALEYLWAHASLAWHLLSGVPTTIVKPEPL